MNKLIIYYSFEGNTEFIAKRLAKRMQADIEKVQPLRELKSKGFSKYVWGGRQAIMKKKPDIQNLKTRVADYDMVIIGTPVWASTYSPPIRTTLSRLDLEGKKVGFFYCHDGGPGKIEEAFRSEVDGSHLVGIKSFVKPLKDDIHEIDKEIEAFAQTLSRAL